MPDYHVGNFDPLKIDLNSKYGYILEVDLSYPPNLHLLHEDFPIAPETNLIVYENLSKYSKLAIELSGDSKNYKSAKLTSTFYDRNKYVLHIKNLQLYLQLGMKLKKIHRIIKFKQKNFLKPFIDLCTEERKKAVSLFEKNQFKKTANSCYGKTLQSIRDYITVKIHQTQKSFLKAISQPSYKSHVIIDENLIITSHKNTDILHSMPYIVGFTILEYSKWFMYDFFYNKLIPKCGKDNIELGFTDTDSFCFKIKNSELFDQKMKKYMDYSNYPKDHLLYNENNKSALGYFKDELEGKSKCLEFVGLRSKCYAMKMKSLETGKKFDKKVCKGLGSVAIRNRLKFNQYKKCLFTSKTYRHEYTSIVSQKQNVFTVIRKKKALSNFDSKRYIFMCGKHTCPYGSFLIEKYRGKCYKCKKIK